MTLPGLAQVSVAAKTLVYYEEYMMDADRCAKILWAITSGFAAEAGDTQNLVDLRLNLALAVFRTNGEGFPEPATDVRKSDAWSGCVQAATEAQIHTEQGLKNDLRFVLIWPEGEPDKPEEKDPPLGLRWPLDNEPDVVVGPVLDASGRKVKLFGYWSIDTKHALLEDLDSGPGLYPRAIKGLDLATPAASGPVGPVPSEPRKYSKGLALFLLISAMGLAAFAMLWVYSATGTLQASGRQLLSGVQKESSDGRIFLKKNSRSLSELKSTVSQPGDNAPPSSTDLACLEMLQARMNGETNDLGKSPCFLAMSAGKATVKSEGRLSRTKAWFWEASHTSGRFSLLIPMAISAAAILALILSAGIALKDSFPGAIVSGRNRISLSRLQQLTWTVVLFGGYSVLGIVNITLLAGFIRDVGQVNALPGEGGLEAGSFFPAMDPSLWALLGLTVVISPYLSKRILSNMDKRADPEQRFETVAVKESTTAPLERRSDPLRARWSDLFTGETVADAHRIDVSRLQHLVITALLLGSYVILLVEYVRTIDATAVLMAMTMGVPVFATMPPVDATFVGLLAVSHAGYLAFKDPAGPQAKPS